mgnify:CR=1 FL=1
MLFLGISKMKLGSVKRSSQKGLNQATALLLEEQRIREEEKARKKKNRFTWHFG